MAVKRSKGQLLVQLRGRAECVSYHALRRWGVQAD